MMAHIAVKSPHARSENDTVSSFDKRQYPSFYRVGDGHYKLHLSGCYGADGLTLSAEDYPGLWEQLHPVPESISETMWTSTSGHNSAGDEALSMHAWATENAQTLSKLKK
jgi:hypothetical protein